MLNLLRTILDGIGIPAIGLAIIIALSTSHKSTRIPKWKLSNTDIQRAKDIIHANQEATGKFITLDLTERDLNIASTYLLNLYNDSQSHIQLKTSYIEFNLLFKLPENLFGPYVPIQFQLHFPPYHSPEIKNLHIGKIAVADIYAGLLIESAISHTRLNQYLALIRKNLKEIKLHSHQLHIKYQRPTDSQVTAPPHPPQEPLAPIIDDHALDLYQQKLNTTLSQHDPDWLLSLSDVLQSLFQLAQQRSTTTTAIAENRLAIFVANRYVNDSPGSSNKQLPPKYPVYLYKRNDMAQHFMWSATLSALGGSQLAQIIGVEKELYDAKSGSGFSFIDLAADRAGMTFGDQATASPEQAMKIQQQMANIKHYQAFMPYVKDLPERLSSQAFKDQYQTVNSPKYLAVLQKIDRRIAESEIYR